MSREIFLASTAIASALFLLIDIFDYVRTRRSEEPLRFRSVLFLLGTLVLYGVIQYAGLLLVPQTEYLIEAIRSILSNFSMFQSVYQTPTLGFWVAASIVSFYVSGFWDYCMHRYVSHSKGLFFTHEYHHIPSQFFLALPGLGARPFVVVSVLPVTILTLVGLCVGFGILGYGSLDLMPLIYAVVFVQSLILAFTHSSFFLRQRWLHKPLRALAITSPQEHEMHHTIDLVGNYGNFTSLWDRIFGTYVDPLLPANMNHRLGLGYDQDFIGTVTLGWVKMPKAWRDYFQVGRFCNIDE